MTETVKMEEMVIENEKMLSIGNMASGMAHEINNPLAGIMQTAGVLSSRLGEKIDIPASIKAAKEAETSIESIKKYMDSRGVFRMLSSISESGQKVASIIDNMLSFARRNEGQVSSQSLNKILDDSLELHSEMGS